MARGSDVSDQRLLERARDGDEDAFEELFRRFARTLETYVKRRMPGAVRRRVSVSDVLQEVRIAAFRGLPTFEWRNDASIRNWLLKIANLTLRGNVRDCRAARRNVDVERSRGDRPATEQFAAQAPSPSQVAAASELARIAATAFRTLPEHDRQVLRLVREEEVTLAGAAERMGRSYEATKKLYARALARFREAYDRLQRGTDGEP